MPAQGRLRRRPGVTLVPSRSRIPDALRLRFFFFKDPAPPEIYPLPLHDALPIGCAPARRLPPDRRRKSAPPLPRKRRRRGKRSEEHTSELQSPYVISYAVFC